MYTMRFSAVLDEDLELLSTGTKLGRILLVDPLRFSMFLRKRVMLATACIWLRSKLLIKVSSFAVS